MISWGERNQKIVLMEVDLCNGWFRRNSQAWLKIILKFQNINLPTSCGYKLIFKNSPGDKTLMSAQVFPGKCFLFPVMIYFAFVANAKSK